jgi:hypothetical protein
LGVEAGKLRTTNVKELVDVLEPAGLLERFAAKKKAGVAATRDFVAIKGKDKVVAKGQVEHAKGRSVEQENELLCFKCLHYSVVESTGKVELVVVKKVPNKEFKFGIRTVDDSAKAGTEF